MRLKVGKIVNTHSLKGEVKVISSTDFEEQRFKKGSELLITRGNQVVKEVVVESYRTHKNNLLVKFVGIDTIEEAEKLKNLQIKIDSDNIGELEEKVQRKHNFAIVDEIDSILIDEARTPLIISGAAEETTEWYNTFAEVAKRLKRSYKTEEIKDKKNTVIPDEDWEDYEVDEKRRSVALTESGIDKIEKLLNMKKKVPLVWKSHEFFIHKDTVTFLANIPL